MSRNTEATSAALLAASCRNGAQRRLLSDTFIAEGREDLAQAVLNARTILISATAVVIGESLRARRGE